MPRRRAYAPKLFAAETLSDAEVVCKGGDLRHAWYFFTPVKWPRFKIPGQRTPSRCIRCGCERFRLYIHGTLASEYRRYPMGYLKPKSQRIPIGTLRIEAVHRLEANGPEWWLVRNSMEEAVAVADGKLASKRKAAS